MIRRIKLSKRMNDQLSIPMIGLRDADILPSSGSSMGSGLSLDYSALSIGGVDTGVPINHTDDIYDDIHSLYTEQGFLDLSKLLKNNEEIFADEVNRLWKIERPQNSSEPIGDTIWIIFSKIIGSAENVYGESTNREIMWDFVSNVVYDTIINKENSASDNVVPFTDDNYGHGSFVGSKEEGFEFRKSLTANKTTKELTAIIVTGNPKHIKNNLAKKFYKEIKKYLENSGYKVSFDSGYEYTSPKKADLWIGHSMGADRLSHYDKDDIKLLAFGALPSDEDNKNMIYVNEPKDQKFMKDYFEKHESWENFKPIDEHFMFTEKMKKAIDKLTKSLDKTGFKLSTRHKLGFPDWPQYSDPQMYSQISERNEATPEFDIFNTYFADDKPINNLLNYEAASTKIRGIVNYFGFWITDLPLSVRQNFDTYRSYISFAITTPRGKNKRTWFDRASAKEAYDLLYSEFKKLPGLTVLKILGSHDDASLVIVGDIEISPELQQKNSEEPRINFIYKDIEPEFESDDIVEAIDDILLHKTAFIKNAITYDSNPIIQKLISIPQIKSLIEQHASGYVDEIKVTTTSSDIQQTQQMIKNDPELQSIQLQQPSGNPYGHMFTYQDPMTHQHKPLDKIVRIDRVTDEWGTLVTILHEISHHRHPEWSESQVESEAENMAGTVKQFVNQKSASNKRKILFAKKNFKTFPLIECFVATSFQDQIIGLQKHSSLKPEEGMLFVYNRPQPVSFHMGTVSFPIDIIFADHNNKIVKICRNCQPNSMDIYSCDNSLKVIEVVGSFCAFHDIDIGDHVFESNDDIYNQEDFTQHIMEKVKEIKIIQQKDLDMKDWNIKVVMNKKPDVRRFIKVNWSDEDYSLKKADIIINPDPELIREAIKIMPLDKIIRHSLLHILVGAKKELPEDKEQSLITSRLFE